jgi:hypothetical protein
MDYTLTEALSDLPSADLDALISEFFTRMEAGLETGNPFTRLYALIAVAGIDAQNAN